MNKVEGMSIKIYGKNEHVGNGNEDGEFFNSIISRFVRNFRMGRDSKKINGKIRFGD